ncbi:MAG TPA: SdpI family protein [Gemmatimonadales bacterium]
MPVAGSSSMIPELLFPVVGALLALLGWPLAARRIGPNRWYGLRVPATFADRRVWFDANALAGRDMIILGVALAAVSLLLPRIVRLPEPVYTAICGGLLGVGALVLTVRGWRAANRLQQARQRPRTGRKR